MIIHMRHANDEEKNPKYKYDTHITKKGKHDTKKLTHEIIEKYGYPDIIIVSPFSRCIETAFIIINEMALIKTGENPHYCLENYDKLEVSTNLSRMFSKSDKTHPSVSSRTLEYKIPIFETESDVSKRVKRHVKKVSRTNGFTLCITHASIYKKINAIMNDDYQERIDFLEYFVNHNEN